MPENRIFYPALDGLRAIAVLLVFTVHYIHKPIWLSWGWTGVDIFFVLSGFLITGILYDTRHRAHRFSTFYIRRTLRIFPLYYGILLLVLLLTPIFHWAWDSGWILWPLYLGNYARFLFLGRYLQDTSSYDILWANVPHVRSFGLNFSHFWSLCVEEQFYLIWPPIVYFIQDRIRLRNLCLAAVVVIPLLRLLTIFVVPQTVLNIDLLYRFAPLRVDALLLGAAVALGLRGPEAEWIKRSARPVALASIAILAAILIGVSISTGQASSPSVHTPWIESIGFTLIDLLAAGVMLLSLVPGSPLYRFFTLSWLRRLGQMSYGFYVFHLLLHDLYRALAVRLFGDSPRINISTAVIAFLGTLVITTLSFRYFETPWLRLKDRFTV